MKSVTLCLQTAPSLGEAKLPGHIPFLGEEGVRGGGEAEARAGGRDGVGEGEEARPPGWQAQLDWLSAWHL